MHSDLEIALLIGGADKPYAFGKATQLSTKGVTLDLIGDDELSYSINCRRTYRMDPKPHPPIRAPVAQHIW
jgi:hypothetical protein